jgi:hypothetical protein
MELSSIQITPSHAVAIQMPRMWLAYSGYSKPHNFQEPNIKRFYQFTLPTGTNFKTSSGGIVQGQPHEQGRFDSHRVHNSHCSNVGVNEHNMIAQ